jgi:folate-binding protein YgfZ
VFRIEQGIPRWGRELTEDTIPVEANLEESCIAYTKGCYIGQEVISRMKMSGQRNKGLYGLVAEEDSELAAGMKLFPTPGREKEAGWLTSATWSDRLGKHIGLCYVKRPFNQLGAELHAAAADGPAVTVKIVNLPFRADAR